MRTFLLILICLESVVLASAAGLHLVGGIDRFQRRVPPIPVFRPPLYEAVIGDSVRYERRDKSGRGVGYLEYEVRLAMVTKGTTLGKEFVVKITETDGAGKKRTRLIRIRPRAVSHGFLPPRFEEDDDYPTGARPVIKSIRSTEFPYRKGTLRGFLLETVIPRESLTETAERYWMSEKIPVFGVARWQSGDDEYVVLRAERGGQG